MKITMYKLLGMVKEGKAPSKIKYDNMIWEYDGNYYCNEKGLMLEEYCSLTTSLNDEVEILEEKKIPDDLYCWFTMDYNDDLHEVIKKSNINFRNISEKLDKILDYLDYLKSKGE